PRIIAFCVVEADPRSPIEVVVLDLLRWWVPPPGVRPRALGFPAGFARLSVTALRITPPPPDADSPGGVAHRILTCSLLARARGGGLLRVSPLQGLLHPFGSWFCLMSGKSAHRFLVFSSLRCSQRYETEAVVVRCAGPAPASDIARCVQLLTIFARLTLLMPKKEAPITSAEYRQLLKEIRSLVEGAKSEKVDGKVAAYWAIGRCLHQKKLSRRAHYGKSIIRDLAADSRLATRTLYDTLHFFESYPKPPIEHGLAWTHYRILLTLTTKKDREFYVQHIQ